VELAGRGARRKPTAAEWKSKPKPKSARGKGSHEASRPEPWTQSPAERSFAEDIALEPSALAFNPGQRAGAWSLADPSPFVGFYLILCVTNALGLRRAPGYVAYPAYAAAVPAPGCYWTRQPVYDVAGNIVGWRGLPSRVCP
jgi:hypothetical protein